MVTKKVIIWIWFSPFSIIRISTWALLNLIVSSLGIFFSLLFLQFTWSNHFMCACVCCVGGGGFFLLAKNGHRKYDISILYRILLYKYEREKKPVIAERKKNLFTFFISLERTLKSICFSVLFLYVCACFPRELMCCTGKSNKNRKRKTHTHTQIHWHQQ